jgi:hypothetical protein
MATDKDRKTLTIDWRLLKRFDAMLDPLPVSRDMVTEMLYLVLLLVDRGATAVKAFDDLPNNETDLISDAEREAMYALVRSCFKVCALSTHGFSPSGGSRGNRKAPAKGKKVDTNVQLSPSVRTNIEGWCDENEQSVSQITESLYSFALEFGAKLKVFVGELVQYAEKQDSFSDSENCERMKAIFDGFLEDYSHLTVQLATLANPYFDPIEQDTRIVTSMRAKLKEALVSQVLPEDANDLSDFHTAAFLFGVDVDTDSDTHEDDTQNTDD